MGCCSLDNPCQKFFKEKIGGHFLIVFGKFAASFNGCDMVFVLKQCCCLATDMSIGVTTIAGGYSRSSGKEDGPAQNASFSSDFELTFVPQICALLLSDHGHQLIRQINLKAEDCARRSHSGIFLVINVFSQHVIISMSSLGARHDELSSY